MNQTDKIIQTVIYHKPEYISRLLVDNGYKLSKRISFQELNEKTFKAIYLDHNKKIISGIESIAKGEYNNFIAALIQSVVSIGTSIIKSETARSDRQLNAKITEANLESQKQAAKEIASVQGETDRTQILADTLSQNWVAAQEIATERQKNVYVYLIGLGVGLAILLVVNKITSK